MVPKNTSKKKEIIICEKKSGSFELNDKVECNRLQNEDESNAKFA